LPRGFAREEVSALLAGKREQLNARSVRRTTELPESGRSRPPPRPVCRGVSRWPDRLLSEEGARYAGTSLTDPLRAAEAAAVIWAADLPKTRSGKIMRRLLRDIADGRDLGDVSTLADPSVVAVLQQAAEGSEG
jgi:hypothetical protein